MADLELPRQITECAKCREYYEANYTMLKYALSTTGIERGKSTWEMAEDYFDELHRREHG